MDVKFQLCPFHGGQLGREVLILRVALLGDEAAYRDNPLWIWSGAVVRTFFLNRHSSSVKMQSTASRTPTLTCSGFGDADETCGASAPWQS